MQSNRLLRGPLAWILSAAILLPALLLLARSLERKAFHNWDLMGYVGCLIEFDTGDPAEIHRRVLEVVETEVPKPIQPRLLAHPQFRHHPDWKWGREVATDPDAFVAQLDWYRPRVGFTALLAVAHRGLGLPPLASLRAVVSASLVALGLLLWAWLGRRLGPWPGAGLALAVVASEPVAGVAKLQTADLTATVPLLAALWALLDGRRAWPALALFLLAVLIRPDHAVTAVIVLLVAGASGAVATQTPRKWLLAGAGGLAAAYVAIGALTHHPGWTRLFYFTFVERRVDLSAARFDLGEYLSAFTGTAWDLGNTSTPLFAALALMLCVALPRQTPDQQRLLLLTRALTAAFALRFVVFPVIWDRFWLPLDLWVLLALVFVATDRLGAGAAR